MAEWRDPLSENSDTVPKTRDSEDMVAVLDRVFDYMKMEQGRLAAADASDYSDDYPSLLLTHTDTMLRATLDRNQKARTDLKRYSSAGASRCAEVYRRLVELRQFEIYFRDGVVAAFDDHSKQFKLLLTTLIHNRVALQEAR